MAKLILWILELFLFASLFTFNVTRQLEMEVSYELVEDFGQPAEEKFERGHRIVRRDVGFGSSSVTTAGLIRPSASNTEMVSTKVPVYSLPTSSAGTTQKTGTKPESSTTGQPRTTTGAPSRSPETSSASSGATKPTGTTGTTGRPEITTERTKKLEDNHKYYKSKYYPNGKKWWFNLEDDKTPKLHEELSKNIIYSDSLKTSFKFPYYGHLIDNVTITNKGYVFLGERVHKYNASAQYVAPLMADFGADIHNNTMIHYVDTGDRFTVEWANMKLLHQKAGEFSFQCSILKNGTLIFAYKKIPLHVSELNKDKFPVRVGFSDTYRRDRIGPLKINNVYYRRVHIIIYYLYHKVELDGQKVVPGSAFVITPQPTCVMFNSCNSCVNSKTEFRCHWCPKLKSKYYFLKLVEDDLNRGKVIDNKSGLGNFKCSDGIDRYRQDWVEAGCEMDSKATCSKKHSSVSTGEIILIVIILVIFCALIFWFAYAYSHPQSKSGMCLIQRGNPRKWFGSSNETQRGSTGGRISFKTMSFESNA